MKRLLATILFLVSFNSYAQSSEWSTLDKTLLAAAMTAQVIDWGQTRNLANDRKFYEQNPLLGPHPSTARVNNYFVAGLVVIPLVAHYFPEYRTAILASWLTVELVATGNNRRIGLKVSF